MKVHVTFTAKKVFISNSCFKKLERGEKQKTRNTKHKKKEKKMMSKEDVFRQEKFRRKCMMFFARNGAEWIAPTANERLKARKGKRGTK